jgi:hypothetical protein
LYFLLIRAIFHRVVTQSPNLKKKHWLQFGSLESPWPGSTKNLTERENNSLSHFFVDFNFFVHKTLIFHFSCGLISFCKTQLKITNSQVFCFFLFLKPARRSLTHFSPLSAHAQHCVISEPQTDLDRRSWFFDGTFIQNSQKKSMEILNVFGAKIKFFFISSLGFVWVPSTCHFVLFVFFVTAWTADGMVCCYLLFSIDKRWD